MPPTIPFPFASDRRRRRAVARATVAGLLPGVLLLPAVAPAGAQVQVAPKPAYTPPDTLLKYLNTLNYDTMQSVPLLVVNPVQWFRPESPLPDHPISLATLAEASHLRIVTTGNLNTLVPPKMTLLTSKPGKANPFAGMRRDELVKILAGSLTAAQWHLIGSSDGIGVGDLTEEQRSLWADIMPTRMDVQKSTVEPGGDPGSWKYTNTTMIPVADMSTVRLRISKQVSFRFSRAGSDEYSYGGSPYFNDMTAGQTKLMVNISSDPDTRDGRSAYGVPLLTETANTEKPGDVDYAAPSLDPRISLHFDPRPALPRGPLATPDNPNGDTAKPDDYGASALPTVDDLVKRINEATHLQFVADRRVRDLPVYLRGDYARCGDILRALTRSVCGTFRKLPPAHPGEPTLYLLTCDREGIGTRIARLAEWGEDADLAKRTAQDKANAQTSKQNPLAALSFASDDRFAPSKQQTDAAEDGWRKTKYASEPEVKWDDLSPALQQGIRSYQDIVQKNGTSLRTDRIRLGEELTTYLVVPNVGAIKDDILGQSIGHQFIEEIAYDPALASPAKPAAPKPPVADTPFVWPAKLTRRLLVAAPATPEEARALAHAAHLRGFTDLWLQVGLADPTASAKILLAGVRAGATEHIAVGASVPLLRDGGMPGELDRNVLDETGEEFATRWIATEHYPDAMSNPRFKAYIDRSFKVYAGWIVPPDAKTLAARLAPIAAVPGLSALTLRNTAGPGWASQRSSGDGVRTNGHLGYTLATRRAFVADYGVDPIDIPDQSYGLRDVRWTLGFFSPDDGEYRFVNGRNVLRPADEVPQLAWSAYRTQTDAKLMAALYADFQKTAPHLPLYLDDRLTPYDQPDVSWFGSWDAPDRLPEHPPFVVDSEAHNAARSRSRMLFPFWGDRWMTRIGTPDDTTAQFAHTLTTVANANQPPKWDGLAVDLPKLPTADVLRLLAGLPVVGGAGQ